MPEDVLIEVVARLSAQMPPSRDNPSQMTPGASAVKAATTKTAAVQFEHVPTLAHVGWSKPTRTTPLERMFVIQLIELTKLTSISIIKQEFTAQFYIEFRVEGGAHDADLVKPSREFPMTADGTPTFLPSAAWYLAQLDFNNAKVFREIDHKIVTDKDDLVLAARFEGTFGEPMELERFPFDIQDLNMSLAMNCRTTGMTPVHFKLADQGTYHHVIEDGFFTQQTEWVLHKKLEVRCYLVGTGERMFPTVEFNAVVARRPHYYLVNIGYPMALFAMMGNFQFALPRYSTADRFNVCISLLLTVVAFKYSVSTMLPTVSYLTVLDTFLLMCGSCVVLACFEAGLTGFILNYAVSVQHERDDLDSFEANDAPARMRKLSPSSNEEELLWETSRQGWVKSMDIFFMLTNMCLLVLSVFWFIWESRKAKASANQIADRVVAPESKLRQKLRQKSTLAVLF